MLKISHLLRSLLLVALALSTAAFALEESSARPRVGLVLGGGGARGAAHIGVLELLEELRVPVDCVVGTSMGALVAGAYASGLSPATMRAELAAADWGDMFVDSPQFSDVAFRNKQIQRRFIPGTETGISAKGITYPPGAVDGEKIKLFFNHLVGGGRSERQVERLPLLLSMIATDIGTGERVVMREGSLTTAMRASMSVPGLLSPVDRDGRKLVDGGLVVNVPISEARERCHADVVIAVNVGSPLMRGEDVGSLLTVSTQMVNILTEQNVTRSLATLKPTDIYIKPDLGSISAGDFARNAEAADRGRAAAETVRQQLAALSVTAPIYAQWREGIDRRTAVATKIDAVEVRGLKRVNPAMVNRQLTIVGGANVDVGAIENDVLRIFGDGLYQSVDYQLLSQRDRNILHILPVEKYWGPDYLRFAMNLEADTNQGSGFSVKGAYHKTLINDYGAEMIASIGLGSRFEAALDLYQPLDPARHYFVESGLRFDRGTTSIYQSDRRLAQYQNAAQTLTLTTGANIGLIGQVRLSWVEQRQKLTREIGPDFLADLDLRYSGWKASLALDQMNRLYFATRGWATRFEYFDSNGAGYSKATVDLLGTFSLGKTVISGRFSHVGSPSGRLPFYDAATLGGFLNMSAFANGQILGDDISYLGVRAEQIVGNFALGLRGDMRFGVALETAHVGNFYTQTNLAGVQLLNSAAIYFGGETPIGPAYLGFGYSTNGASNLFLSIGIP